MIINNVRTSLTHLFQGDVDQLNSTLLKDLTPSSLASIKTLSYEAPSLYTKQALLVLKQYLNEGIKSKNSWLFFNHLYKQLRHHQLPEDIAHAAAKVSVFYIKPNLMVDDHQTELTRQEAIKSIDYETTIIKQGQPIIYKSDRITDDHIDILKTLHIYKVESNLITFFIKLIYSMKL